MSILAYNGAALCAMAGDGCVAIGSDTRFGIEQQTLATDYGKVYRINDRVFVGLGGLLSDAQTLYQRILFRTNLYKLREERDMKPSTLTHMLSSVLYEKRFGPYFVEPLVAGLEADGTPYLACMDLLGCPECADDFVVGGTCAESLHGACESMYRPGMGPEELFETVSQCLLNSQDRDCLSGWGAVVHVITKDKVITRTLKTRQD